MLNVSPQQPPIKLDERKAKLKAKLVFQGLLCVSQPIYSLSFGKNLYLNV
jgi:hypothetical protein